MSWVKREAGREGVQHEHPRDPGLDQRRSEEQAAVEGLGEHRIRMRQSGADAAAVVDEEPMCEARLTHAIKRARTAAARVIRLPQRRSERRR